MKTKNISLLLFILVNIINNGISQSLSYDWSQSYGSTGEDIGKVVKISNDNFIYEGGTFNGSVDFNPSGTADIGTSFGLTDGFLTKKDTNGVHQWSIFFNSTNNLFVEDVVIDLNNDIYIVGRCDQNMQADDGTNQVSLTTITGLTAFVVKCQNNGTILWVKGIESQNTSSAYGIAIDSQNNFYLVGSFSDNTDFDMNAGTSFLNTTSSTDKDIFIAKYTTNGNLIQALSYGQDSYDVGKSITIDSDDNIIVTGLYQKSPDFNLSANVNTLAYSTASGIFIAKYDSSGNYIFAYGLPKSSGTGHLAGEVIVDNNDNIYLCGSIAGSVDLDPSAATYTVTGNSGWYVFYAKYDKNGNFVWGNSFGNTSSNYGKSIALDASNNLYLTGYYKSNMIIDDAFGNTNTLVPNGQFDNFIARFDTVGVLLWSESVGGDWYDGSNSIDVDQYGSVYVAGYFATTTNLDPSGIATPHVSNGSSDAFLLKFNGGCTISFLNTIVSNNQICLGDSVVITSTGMDNITYSNGILDGQYFIPDSSNTYFVYGTNNGYLSCGIQNSFLIEVTQPTYATDIITSCSNYTWINNVTYTNNNNTATYTMPNSVGCDSIITLNLTIITVDVSTTLIANTITANFTGATTYQWLDCNNNSIISGENSQSYTATANGSYAVEVTQNGCTDTSVCVSISTVSILENERTNQISIYPNPFSSSTTIKFENVIGETYKLSVFDYTGKLIQTISNITDSQIILNKGNFNNGIYFLHLQNSNGEIYTKKVIIE